MIQLKVQLHLFVVLAALLSIICHLVLSLAALIVTVWLPIAFGATCFLIHIQRKGVLLPTVDSSSWIFCVSAYLMNRDTGCLCYEWSF